MTAQQDRDIFRRVYDLYQGLKRAGSDRAQWEQLTQAATDLMTEYADAPFVTDLIRAVYSEIHRLYTPPAIDGGGGR